jgi:hypothetical protein
MIVYSSTTSRTRHSIDETLTVGGLERQFCFVASSNSHLRCHNLCFQCLIHILGACVRFAFLLEFSAEVVVLCFESDLVRLLSYAIHQP